MLSVKPAHQPGNLVKRNSRVPMQTFPH